MTTVNKIQCHNFSLCVAKINLTLKAILERQAAFTGCDRKRFRMV